MVVLVVTVGGLTLTPVVILGGYFYVYGKNHENLRFPEEDVTVARCARDPEARRAAAELSVTSRAARQGTYTVTVEFRDGRGTLVEQGSARVEKLLPGATGRTTVVGAVPYGRGRGAPRCAVVDAAFQSTVPRGERTAPVTP
ncbi:hypothetical protein [Streptomyces laurentii]|uniref:hypothetical protein n=1 Tax=Streptomyces laurentii TaxID=39478 RepID=UPI0036C8A2AA